MKICLDIDGVLADFVGATAKLMGFDPAIVTCWNYFDKIGITESHFWDRIHSQGENFWADLEPYPWMADLVKACQDVAPTILLTSPSSCSTSAAGKVRWMKRHLGDRFRDYLIGSKKEFCAHGDSVLIDDSDANCDKFGAHGGYAILFPQPWNLGRDLDGCKLERTIKNLEAVKGHIEV